MNTPFCEDVPDIPEYLQPKIVNVLNSDPEPFKNLNKDKKPKIIVTSNIVIEEASPEERIILSDIQTQINKRKRRRGGTSQEKSSIVKKKKKLVYHSDSSLTSETSFHAADDSDYENFDEYIASCLQEQEEQDNIDQENRCPWGLRKILSINDQIPTVKFARKVKNSKSDKGTVFTYPNIEDICAVHDLNDVVAILSDPQISRRGHFTFNLDFNKYNIQ
ncbi:unnamed protein product [Euphydryas editha]|uniref:Uncharacterized protein n=1 Tax=Euphydryas editha TaxID=104508 RepID=A0AAU9UR40_EUPED|nr:unnamed protein product [Euphydryas editha]